MVSKGFLRAKSISDTISLIVANLGLWVKGQGQIEFKWDRSIMFRVCTNLAIYFAAMII